MTTPHLVSDLQRDEGLRLVAYPDPLSHGEPFTIGYGHTGDVLPGERWTQDEANQTLADDISDVERNLDAALPWWRTLDDVRQDCIANMTFNLGIGGLLKFHNMLADCHAHDFEGAANEMMDSHWATQVGNRAHRLAFMMRNGERPA